LRMDSANQYKTYGEGVIKGLLAPNEGRKKLGLKPVSGGNSPMLQQQNFSLEALAKRDAQDDPFAAGKAPPAKPEQPKDDGVDEPAPATDAAEKVHPLEYFAALKKALPHVST